MKFRQRWPSADAGDKYEHRGLKLSYDRYVHHCRLCGVRTSWIEDNIGAVCSDQCADLALRSTVDMLLGMMGYRKLHPGFCFVVATDPGADTERLIDGWHSLFRAAGMEPPILVAVPRDVISGSAPQETIAQWLKLIDEKSRHKLPDYLNAQLLAFTLGMQEEEAQRLIDDGDPLINRLFHAASYWKRKAQSKGGEE